MQNKSIINPSNTTSTKSNLDKIHDWKPDRVSRSLNSTASMQTAANLILIGHLEPAAGPHSSLRTRPANTNRDNPLRPASIQLGRHFTTNRSRHNHPHSLK